MLLMADLSAAAQNDVSTRAQIAQVQQNHESYFRGDATDRIPARAQSRARQMLLEEIEAYQDTARHTAVDTATVFAKLNRIESARGDQFRSFIFVKRSEVLTAAAPPLPADSAKSITKAGKHSTLDQLKRLRTLSELLPFLVQQRTKGAVLDYNRYSALHDASGYHVVIYSRDRQIVALLSPGHSHRINLKTNDTDSIDRYEGCFAIAILLSPDH